VKKQQIFQTLLYAISYDQASQKLLRFQQELWQGNSKEALA